MIDIQVFQHRPLLYENVTVRWPWYDLWI